MVFILVFLTFGGEAFQGAREACQRPVGHPGGDDCCRTFYSKGGRHNAQMQFPWLASELKYVLKLKLCLSISEYHLRNAIVVFKRQIFLSGVILKV